METPQNFMAFSENMNFKGQQISKGVFLDTLLPKTNELGQNLFDFCAMEFQEKIVLRFTDL